MNFFEVHSLACFLPHPSTFSSHVLLPSKGDRLILPSGCNTAAPELHLRSAVAKSASTLDAFPDTTHPTPLAKVNAFPPANSHHPPYDCLRLSAMHYSWLSRFVFYWFVVFALILMHQLRLFAFVYFLLVCLHLCTFCLIFLGCHMSLRCREAR